MSSINPFTGQQPRFSEDDLALIRAMTFDVALDRETQERIIAEIDQLSLTASERADLWNARIEEALRTPDFAQLSFFHHQHTDDAIARHYAVQTAARFDEFLARQQLQPGFGSPSINIDYPQKVGDRYLRASDIAAGHIDGQPIPRSYILDIPVADSRVVDFLMEYGAQIRVAMNWMEGATPEQTDALVRDETAGLANQTTRPLVA